MARRAIVIVWDAWSPRGDPNTLRVLATIQRVNPDIRVACQVNMRMSGTNVSSSRRSSKTHDQIKVLVSTTYTEDVARDVPADARRSIKRNMAAALSATSESADLPFIPASEVVFYEPAFSVIAAGARARPPRSQIYPANMVEMTLAAARRALVG